MQPTRQKLIGENRVAEYRWDSRAPEVTTVYVNGKIAWGETYDQAVARLEREE